MKKTSLAHILSLMLLIALLLACSALTGCITPLNGNATSPQEPDNPVARKAVVSMLAWKTLKADTYSVRYPENWTFIDVFVAKALSPDDAKGEVDLFFVYLKDSESAYDELTRENFVNKLLDEKYAGFGCDVFDKGIANGKRAIFCVYTGELEGKKYTIYCYLAENGNDLLFIYCCAENEAYQTYLPEIETIVSSLKFR